MDGLVLARSGFHSSANYRSVMAFGEAEAVEDPDHKLAALEAMMERLVPGRWPTLKPPTRQELKATTRSEEHTSELQSIIRISYAVFCLKTNKTQTTSHKVTHSRKQYTMLLSTDMTQTK